jgi:competence protein ComEA
MKFYVVAIAALTLLVSLSIQAGAAVQVNINIASKEELMQLEGIGSAYAAKIIEYRETNGPFEKPEDIMNVKGIGEVTYEKNKHRITVTSGEMDTFGSE